MTDRSTPGQRVLGARRTIAGADDALENLLGDGLHDGAQCYVIEEQATYRFVADSELPADGKFVVATIRKGRFIRESGLAAFALLDDGSLGAHDGSMLGFGEYSHTKVVQFEVTESGGARYIGTVPRLATVHAWARVDFDRGQADLFVRLDNSKQLIAASSLLQAGFTNVSTVHLLLPGDTLSLGLRAAAAIESSRGSLRVVML